MVTVGRQRPTILLVCAVCAILARPASGQPGYPPNGPTIAPVPLTGNAPVPFPAPKNGPEQSQWNMELAGHNDLQGRSAYQPIIISQDGRFIAYVGHHATAHLPMNSLTGKTEPSGTSIVDVTDPANTRYLAHIPGPSGGGGGDSGGAQMVRVCSGSVLPNGVRGKWYLLRPRGGQAHEIFDVTDPSKPALLTTVVDQLTGTHKSWWECDTGIAYLVGNKASEGWTGGNHVKIYDLSNPAKPVYIRDFGLLGSQPNATSHIGVSKGIGIHGLISAGPERNRVYLAYGSGHDGVLQIVDRKKLLTAFKNPLNPTDEEMLAPQVGYVVMSPDQGAHTTMPLFDVPIPTYQGHAVLKTRDLVIITSEQGRGDHCNPGPGGDRPAPHMAFLVDVTNEATPWNLSTFHVDERVGDFCGRGGRFGAHAGTESFYPQYYGKLAIFSWFNAGTRVFDIRNPFDVKEIAYFIPAVNKNTMSFCVDGISHPDGDPAITSACTKVIQTNNVEIDDRGLIYSADRAGTGLHIMRLTGEAAAAVAATPGTN
jgi:hypothetical protein